MAGSRKTVVGPDHHQSPPGHSTQNGQQQLEDQEHPLSPAIKDQNVTSGMKAKMISDFFGCRFGDYADILESNFGRKSVFRKPTPALDVPLMSDAIMKRGFVAQEARACLKINYRYIARNVCRVNRATFQ